MYKRSSRRFSQRVAVTSLTCGFFVAAMPAIAAPAIQSYDFNFVVSAPALDHSADDRAMPEQAAQGLEDGAIVNARDVLATLAPAQASPTVNRSAFGAGLVMANLVHSETGQSWHYPVAQCDSIDFQSSNDLFFDQQVLCDDRIVGFATDQGGIVITVDGEKAFAIDLAPGAYLINGVPGIAQ